MRIKNFRPPNNAFIDFVRVRFDYLQPISRLCVQLLVIALFTGHTANSLSAQTKDAVQTKVAVQAKDAVQTNDALQTKDIVAETTEVSTLQQNSAEPNSDGKAKSKWKPLFDGKTLDGWKSTAFGGEGEVKVVEGEIRMVAGVTLTGITCTQEIPKVNYEIEYEAKRTEGLDFFAGLTFPFKDSHCSFIAAGWGGSVTGLSSIDDNDASENDTTTFQKFEDDTWYKFRVRVTDNAIQCWVNDKQVVDQKIDKEKVSIRPELVLCKPLAFCCWQSDAALKNIRLRELKKDK